MERIDSSLRDELVRQGLGRRTVGAESLQGMDAGCMRDNMHPATARRGGGSAADWEMIMKLGRKVSVRPTLIIIDGGKR